MGKNSRQTKSSHSRSSSRSTSRPSRNHKRTPVKRETQKRSRRINSLIRKTVRNERKGKGLKLPSHQQVYDALSRSGDSGALGVYRSEVKKAQESGFDDPFAPEALKKKYHSDSDSEASESEFSSSEEEYYSDSD